MERWLGLLDSTDDASGGPEGTRGVLAALAPSARRVRFAMATDGYLTSTMISERSFLSRLREARDAGRPLLAFNAFDLASVRGVLAAAAVAESPVIIQFSSRTVSRLRPETLLGIARTTAKHFGVDAFVHLDHCRDERVLADSIDAGFDGVMVDGSHLDAESNIELTSKWVRRAQRAGCLVEAEFSPIRGTEDGIDGSHSTQPLDFEAYFEFCDRIGAALVGADVGTSHGRYAEPPRIDFAAIEKLAAYGDAGFVIHGGSGLDASILMRLALLRVVKINFSTDLKDAWLDGVSASDSQPEPFGSLVAAETQIEKMALAKWKSTKTEVLG